MYAKTTMYVWRRFLFNLLLVGQKFVDVIDDDDGLLWVEVGRTPLLAFVGAVDTVEDDWKALLGQVLPVEQWVDHGNVALGVELRVVEELGRKLQKFFVAAEVSQQLGDAVVVVAIAVIYIYWK